MSSKDEDFAMKRVLCFFSILCLTALISCQKEIIQPDEQFLKLHFRYGFGNELNTFAQSYTKDLVFDGYITIDFWLTTEEQQQVIEKMEEVDFLNLPDTIATYSQEDSIVFISEPNPGRQFILAEYNNISKEVSWYLPFPNDISASESILELDELIIDIIHSKPEYQNLPEPRGSRL